MTRPIIFLDANTIWHRRLAEALATQVPLIAINPVTGIFPKQVSRREDGLNVVEVTLPRGWASTSAFIGQRILRNVIETIAAQFETIPCILLSSPAYAHLASLLDTKFQVVSYTADDYRGYIGWGGEKVKRQESRIHSRANISVFVSAALRNRAIAEFGLSPDGTVVSTNATERRFAQRGIQLPPELRDKAGPVVGILGGLSERLDLKLIAGVAASPSVGTFVVAGPADDGMLKRSPIFESKKFIVTGPIPHSTMHEYALALDIALIPYSRSQLNHFCSPMRLFDHLATGVPIFASDGCDQMDNGSFHTLKVAPTDELVRSMELFLRHGLPPRRSAPEDCFWEDRAQFLLKAFARMGMQAAEPESSR